MAQAAYIHIPFCAHKCDFCDFAAFAGVDELSEEYANVVVAEIRERSQRQPNAGPLTSVFYGGGTPGYIHPTLLGKVHTAVIDFIGVSDGAEVTLETTPQSITHEKALSWKDIGINRISVGVQSFNDNELVAMGRDHTAEEAIRGITTATEAGIDNVALDLMYGLPEQTLISWEQSLERALNLKPPHMSAYGLTIANNSPLLSRYPRSSDKYPSEDDFVTMYQMLIDKCAAAGLQQYEISNFAVERRQSAHNLTYWTNQEYLAFGVSAHRYVNEARSSNYRSLKRYMKDYLADETFERIDEDTRAKEAIFLGLRLRRGINLLDFQSRYGFDLEEVLGEKLVKLSEGGFVEVSDGWLKLSQAGVLVSNLVLSELV
jgi:oxygen-independent coproporphyrinogen III oxidase